MKEKQEIGLLLQERSAKDMSMEKSSDVSISNEDENYSDILSKQSHKHILKWMENKDLGKVTLCNSHIKIIQLIKALLTKTNE